MIKINFVFLLWLTSMYAPLTMASMLMAGACENEVTTRALENLFNGEFQRLNRLVAGGEEIETPNDEFGKMEKQYREQVSALRRSVALIDPTRASRGHKLDSRHLVGQAVIGFNETREFPKELPLPHIIVTRNFFAGVVQAVEEEDGQHKITLSTSDGFERILRFHWNSFNIQRAQLLVLGPAR